MSVGLDRSLLRGSGRRSGPPKDTLLVLECGIFEHVKEEAGSPWPNRAHNMKIGSH